jgi:hypothetical protein
VDGLISDPVGSIFDWLKERTEAVRTDDFVGFARKIDGRSFLPLVHGKRCTESDYCGGRA